MGKIKVRTLGTDHEDIQKQKAHKKAQEKSASRRTVKGAKGGERVVFVGPSEEELARLSVSGSQLSDSGQPVDQSTRLENSGQAGKPKTGKLKSENRKRKTDNRNPHSKSYQAVARILDKSKKYSLLDGLEMLEKLKRSKFDETVELHINTVETGISSNINLPYGTGKIVRVAIADDDVLAKVAAGKIDFDILLAAPIMMPKLAKVAKILGPKGLMPNPKNGTLTKDPGRLALSFAKGQMNFKTEAKAPIMHLTVGKMSFGAKKLSENIETLIDAIKKEKIRNVTLKSTMSPGIKLDL